MTTTDGRSKLRKAGREMLIPTQALILRFRIELLETEPLVWRSIEVPGDYTFWDLHVAIQDAMGWLDYHYTPLHHPTSTHEEAAALRHQQPATGLRRPAWLGHTDRHDVYLE